MTFDKLYLADVVECQGELFQYAYLNDKDILEFALMYMKSNIRKEIDNGCAYYLTMLGRELYAELGFKSRSNWVEYDTMPDWYGQFLALLQFRTRIPSSELDNVFSFEHILRIYNVYHDLDLELAVKRMVEDNGVAYYG